MYVPLLFLVTKWQSFVAIHRCIVCDRGIKRTINIMLWGWSFITFLFVDLSSAGTTWLMDKWRSRSVDYFTYSSVVRRCAVCSENSENQKAFTRDRSDHLSRKNTTKYQLAACYLFTVSNSGLVLATVGSSRLKSASIAKKEHFIVWPWTLNFDLWLLPSNLI